MRYFSITLVFLASLQTAMAQDWPQYSGPTGDRVAPTGSKLQLWPEIGPKTIWKVPTRLGFSSFTVVGDRAFTLVALDGVETCVALSTADGAQLWSRQLARSAYDRGGDSGTTGNVGGDGPRSTPSHDGEHVYVFDAQLRLYCLAEATGEIVWMVDLIADHSGRNLTWQNAASPLVVDDAVHVAGGGPGESLLAFDKLSGEAIWARYDERITHATPILATIHGVRQVIYFMQSGLLSIDPDLGDVLWRVPYTFRVSTAASPVVDGDVVYCSAGYGVGAGAFRIIDKDGKFDTELLWRKRNKLINHWSTPVVKNGHLYGMFSFKKYGSGPLKCVDILTGETMWSADGYGPGNCIVVGEHIVALSDSGELVIVDANPAQYTELCRADVLEGKCWSSPSFADGQLYVRSTAEGARYDLKVSSGM